jgi:hypothetical protein
MGEVVQMRPKYLPDAFERFWEAYPLKVKKGPARRQWQWAMEYTGFDADRIVAGAAAYAAKCRRDGTEDRYIQAPHKWLQDERWDDVYEKSSPIIDPETSLDRARASSITKLKCRVPNVDDAGARRLIALGFLIDSDAKAAGYDV